MTKMTALGAVSQTCLKAVHKFQFELWDIDHSNL